MKEIEEKGEIMFDDRFDESDVLTRVLMPIFRLATMLRKLWRSATGRGAEEKQDHDIKDEKGGSRT